MLSVEEIKRHIEADAASKKKQLAKVGQRYYEGDHDIKDFKILFLDKEGKLKEDKVKSNIKICHPFFTELVDQEVQYMLSGEKGFVRGTNKKSVRPAARCARSAFLNQKGPHIRVCRTALRDRRLPSRAALCRRRKGSAPLRCKGGLPRRDGTAQPEHSHRKLRTGNP